MVSLALAGILAAILGFAAHRASICTVRAVSEVLSSRTGYMLASIGKSALWVIALTLPAFWIMPATAAGISGWPLTASAAAGGFLFGLGAAINGGCAYSTMARLVDGEAAMAMAVIGFALGIMGFVALVDLHWLARPRPAPSLVGSVLGSALLLALPLLAWGVYETVRLCRTRERGLTLRARIMAPQYRFSTAALLIAGAGAAIFLLIGSPGYTITVQGLVEGAIHTRAWPPASRTILLLAALAGMLISTLARGSFRLDLRPRLSWLRHIGGGMLMGLGSAMLPGGNDALVLYGIPSFSPHALPAYAALIVGVALGVVALQRFGINCSVVCRNDLYLAERQPKGSILNGHAPRG